MDNYLDSISKPDGISTSTALPTESDDSVSIIEPKEDYPTATSSSIADETILSIQDNAQYLSPKKIELRKYTLKKG